MSETSSEPVDDSAGLPDVDRIRPIPARAAPPGPDRRPSGGGGQHGGRSGRGSAESAPTGAPAAPPARPAPPPPPTPPSSAEGTTLRRFTAAGIEWVARVVGHGSSGGTARSSAPLTLVTFEHADRQDEPVREMLRVGRDLSELSDSQLAELLERARPFNRSTRRQALFSETRVGKKGGE